MVFLKAGTLKCARFEFSNCRVTRGPAERGRDLLGPFSTFSDSCSFWSGGGEGRGEGGGEGRGSGPQSRWGFTRQPENSKRAHLRVPAFKNTTKIPREDPQRKRMKMVAGNGKKASGPQAPPFEAPFEAPLSPPFFWGGRGEGGGGRAPEMKTHTVTSSGSAQNCGTAYSGAAKSVPVN